MLDCFLLNSTKVRSENANQIESITLTIKKTLTKLQNYKSFYIIFIKKENINRQENKVHSADMEISTTQ